MTSATTFLLLLPVVMLSAVLLLTYIVSTFIMRPGQWISKDKNNG